MANKKEEKRENKKFEDFFRLSLKNEKLTQILKYLIKGLVKYQDKDLETSITKYGKFVSLAHGHLFENLNNVIKKKIHLIPWQKKDHYYFSHLYYEIFPELKIKNKDILLNTRKIYMKRSDGEHQEDPKKLPYPPENLYLLITINCVQLYLLLILINKRLSDIREQYDVLLLSDKKMSQSLKEYTYTELRNEEIDLNKEFSIILRKNYNEILETFTKIIFQTNIKNKLIDNRVLSNEYIKNSTFLRAYYPFIPFEIFKIDIVLKSESVMPFRPDGPHIIDFSRGNWIHIPESARSILNVMRCTEDSILIRAPSGCGKTVISRFLGYNFYENQHKVYYIDILNYKKDHLNSLLNQIGYNKELRKNSSLLLFIFENIHALDYNSDIDLFRKLDEIKNNFKCLITERVFEHNELNLPIKFNKNRIVNYNQDSRNFKNIVLGIIERNSQDIRLTSQLKLLNLKNLWIYAIIFKLFNQSISQNHFYSINNILTNTELIAEELSQYFIRLLSSKHIHIPSFEFDDYKYAVMYILAILSIFSEFELSLERDFIIKIIKIKDSSPIGQLNAKLNISFKTVSSITTFLIDIHEIEKNKSEGFMEKSEYRIPHSQMALIYKNCFLMTFENLYPDLIDQIINYYIFYGKYSGTFLNKKWEKWTLSLSPEESVSPDLIYFDFEKFLNMSYFPDSSKYKVLNLKSFIGQLENRSLGEIITFCERISLDGVPKEKDRISQLLIYLILLDNSYWKIKINNSNYRDIYYFLEMIKESLSEKCLLNFFSIYKKEILREFSQSTINYLLRLIFLITNLPNRDWVEISDVLKDYIINNDANFNDFEWSLRIFEDYEEKIVSNSYILSIIKLKIKQYISNSNFSLDISILDRRRLYLKKFIEKIYFDFLKEALNKDPKINIKNKSILQGKIKETNLDQICTYLYELNSRDPFLSKEFFIHIIDDIKFLMNKADAPSLRDFFMELISLDFNPNIIIQYLLKDWNWFQNLFLKFSITELLEIYYPIFNQFFGYYIKSYANEYQSLIYSIIKNKLLDYYKQLENKVDIYKIISRSPLFDTIKDDVLQLLENAIKQSIKDSSLNLKIFADFLNEINKIYYNKTLVLQGLNFEIINSDPNFKNLLYSAREKAILEFMKILEKYDKWYQLFLDEFNDFLSQKFGEGFRIAQQCSENGKNFLIKLPSYFQTLNIEKITLISNSTFRSWYDLKYGSDNVQNMIKVDRYFQEFIYENIRKNEIKFLDDNFKDVLLNIDIDILLNFIIILFKCHNEILRKIFNKYGTLIKDIYRNSQFDLFYLLYILKKYELSIKSLKEIDADLLKENFFYSLFLKSFKTLDLFRLRKVFQVLLDRYDRYDNSKDIIELLKEIEFKKNLETSNLLQISIALHNDHINLLKKPAGLVFFRGQKKTRQVRVEPEIFNDLTEGLKNIIEEKQKDFRNVFLNDILPEEKKIFINKSVFFSSLILLKMKGSNLFAITQYLETLISWYEEFKEVIINPPAEFFDFFKSEGFINLINSSSFTDINDFFFTLLKLYPDFSKYIWEENSSYFKSLDFKYKLQKAKYSQIYYFFMFNLSSSDQLTPDIVKLLKEKIESNDFKQLIQSLIQFNHLDLAFNLSNFKKEINKIILNTSKKFLKYGLQDHFLSKEEKNNLRYIKENLPIINQKINEKYFFEP